MLDFHTILRWGLGCVRPGRRSVLLWVGGVGHYEDRGVGGQRVGHSEEYLENLCGLTIDCYSLEGVETEAVLVYHVSGTTLLHNPSISVLIIYHDTQVCRCYMF